MAAPHKRQRYGFEDTGAMSILYMHTGSACRTPRAAGEFRPFTLIGQAPGESPVRHPGSFDTVLVRRLQRRSRRASASIVGRRAALSSGSKMPTVRRQAELDAHHREEERADLSSIRGITKRIESPPAMP